MTRYKLTLCYDGTSYAGWQVQPNRPTIQGEIEDCLRRLTSHHSRVHASGRTDCGVHAMRQVAHVDLVTAVPAGELKRGLNALLSSDIRVRQVKSVPDSFHARYSATGKEYRYHVWNGDVVPPFERRYCLHIPRKLDLGAMIQAAGCLVGRHDFQAFSANPKREQGSTVRELSSLVVRKVGSHVAIAAVCEGFLYKMCRSLAGFLIQVGEGRERPEAAREILRSRIRTARVPTAAAQGLFLWRVFYGSFLRSGSSSAVKNDFQQID